MRSMVEFTALATIGILVLWLLRKHLTRVAPAVVAMAGLTMAAAFAAPAANAGQVEHGQPNYTLAAGQTVHTDLIVFATSARIDGDVDGDLIVWSESVTVNGHVKGDRDRVRKRTAGERAGGRERESVRFDGGFEFDDREERIGVGGKFQLNASAKVNGNALLGTGNALLEGPIAGDLQAYGNEMEVDDSIGRNLYIRAAHLKIGPKTDVAGTATYHGRHAATQDAGAKFATPLTTSIISEDENDKYTSLGYYWHQVLRWGAAFVFGLVLLLLVPAFFFDAFECIEPLCTVAGIWSAVFCLRRRLRRRLCASRSWDWA